MTIKKLFALLVLALLFYLSQFFGGIPAQFYTKAFLPPALPQNSSVLAVPLDSRPPCTTMVQKLGYLASIDVILPPQSLLDNYEQPADRQGLWQWLNEQMPKEQAALISSDLLIHGGLLNSRVPFGSVSDGNNFLKQITALHAVTPQTQLTVFTVIPRLLVSDQLIPDRWYQWHLMRYATLKDMEETFGDPYIFQQLQEISARIPDEIKIKYNSLYNANDNFNKNLINAAQNQHFNIVIGQDDAQPFGLPNRNLNHALAYLTHTQLHNRGQTTYGADEITQLLLTKYYNTLHYYTPQIFIEYSHPQVADKIMPYMPGSVAETVRDKLAMIGAKQALTPETADFILFIHCGDKTTPPTLEIAERVKTLLNSKHRLALVDLTANYDAEELLLPKLLKLEAPLNKLSAFAAWNTLSNSLGTALSQASIFTGQLRILPKTMYPSLYAANANFIAERLLDDWAYQKIFHAKLSTLLKIKGINPTKLEDRYWPTLWLQNFLQLKRNELLYGNLGRTPFYQDEKGKYYITAIDVEASFPWSRIFEINLQTQCHFGIMPLS